MRNNSKYHPIYIFQKFNCDEKQMQKSLNTEIGGLLWLINNRLVNKYFKTHFIKKRGSAL